MNKSTGMSFYSLDLARGCRRVVNGATTASSRVSSSGPTSLNQLREWSVSSYRCTRQALSERLGLTSVISTTCNPELQCRVTVLRDARSQCIHISTVANAMATHLEDVVRTQRQIARTFTTLSIECADLSDEFLCNAEANHVLHRNGSTLIGE